LAIVDLSQSKHCAALWQCTLKLLAKSAGSSDDVKYSLFLYFLRHMEQSIVLEQAEMTLRFSQLLIIFIKLLKYSLKRKELPEEVVKLLFALLKLGKGSTWMETLLQMPCLRFRYQLNCNELGISPEKYPKDSLAFQLMHSARPKAVDYFAQMKISSAESKFFSKNVTLLTSVASWLSFCKVKSKMSDALSLTTICNLVIAALFNPRPNVTLSFMKRLLGTLENDLTPKDLEKHGTIYQLIVFGVLSRQVLDKLKNLNPQKKLIELLSNVDSFTLETCMVLFFAANNIAAELAQPSFCKILLHASNSVLKRINSTMPKRLISYLYKAILISLPFSEGRDISQSIELILSLNKIDRCHLWRLIASFPAIINRVPDGNAQLKKLVSVALSSNYFELTESRMLLKLELFTRYHKDLSVLNGQPIKKHLAEFIQRKNYSEETSRIVLINNSLPKLEELDVIFQLSTSNKIHSSIAKLQETIQSTSLTTEEKSSIRTQLESLVDVIQAL